VIRRLTLELPVDRGRPDIQVPVRLLAVSDEAERAFDYERNRTALLPIDGIIGAGDLRPDYLDFLTGAFKAPLLYVLGNHDRGGGWQEGQHHVPEAIDGTWHALGGLEIAGLSWPSDSKGRAIHDDNLAWRQVAGCFMRVRGRRPDIIVSHVPPLGLGDTPEDHYHRGFAAYRWLLDRLKPPVWIHGHTALAAADHWWVSHGQTTVINVTGAVLLELVTSDKLVGASDARTWQSPGPSGSRTATRSVAERET
jgi:Icc-related predicted phosphoesterase